MQSPFTFPVIPEAFVAYQETLCGFPIRGELRGIMETWVQSINEAYEDGLANDTEAMEESLELMDQFIATHRNHPVMLKPLKAARNWIIYAWKQGQKERAE